MTYLTPAEHERSDAVVVAAQWLSEQTPAPTPTVPALRSRFNLTALEACEAAAMAQRFRSNRKAFG